MAPLTETGIEVVFTPESIDDDIRREGVLCMIEVDYFASIAIYDITVEHSNVGMVGGGIFYVLGRQTSGAKRFCSLSTGE